MWTFWFVQRAYQNTNFDYFPILDYNDWKYQFRLRKIHYVFFSEIYSRLFEPEKEILYIRKVHFNEILFK